MKMLEWIISSTVLILIVIALRFVLKGKISLRLQYALWVIVLLRLILPVSFGSATFSVGNLTQKAAETEVGQIVSALSDTELPRKTYRAAYDEVEKEYAAKGVEISEMPLTEYEKVDYEIMSRMGSTRSIRDIVKIVWLVGIAAVGLILIASNIRFAVRLKKSRQRLEGQSVGLTLYVSPNVDTPCLFGLFRPAIYLTPDAAADDTILRHSIQHELTHFHHGDHFWSLLRSVCLALHWYNPLVWQAAVLSRNDAELACDEATIRRIGENERAEYGRTLIQMTCQKRPALLLTATTMTGSSIKERIMMLAKKPKTAIYTLIAVILITSIAVGCTFIGAEKDDTDHTDEALAIEAQPLTNDVAESDNPDNSGLPENTDSPADHSRPDIQISVSGDIPQAVTEYAVDYTENELLFYTDELGYDITEARIIGLTEINTGAAGLNNGINMYLLEYRFLAANPDEVMLTGGMQMEDNNITEGGSTGQPYLLLHWWDNGENTSWDRICVTNSLTVQEEYNTPEMLEQYGNMYTAAAMELYSTYRKNQIAVTVDYAAEEVYGSGLVHEIIADNSDLAVNVQFSAKSTVTNFQLLAVNLETVDDAGNIQFSIAEELCSLPELTPEKPLAARLIFAGDIPNIGISYIDASGIEQTYAVTVSGRDDSLILLEADITGSQNEMIDLKEITFYHIDPEYNTLGAEIHRQEDGTYYLPSEVSVFIDFYDEKGLKPITAYFTPRGANHAKQIGYANPPWPQMPISLKLSFAEEDTEGLLFFVFDCGDGTSMKSEQIPVLIEHSGIVSPADVVDDLFASGDISLTLNIANAGTFNTYLADKWYSGRFKVLLSGYEWTKPELTPIGSSDFWLTAVSADGTKSLTFRSSDGAGMVQYNDGNTATYWNASPTYEFYKSIAEDIRREYDNLDVDFARIAFFLDGSAEAAADFFVHNAYGSHMTSLAPGNMYGIRDYEVVEWEVRRVSESGDAVVGAFQCAFTPVFFNSVGIWAGNTSEGTGDYEGKLTFYREFALQRQEDGYWHCVDLGTGGVPLPE